MQFKNATSKPVVQANLSKDCLKNHSVSSPVAHSEDQVGKNVNDDIRKLNFKKARESFNRKNAEDALRNSVGYSSIGKSYKTVIDLNTTERTDFSTLLNRFKTHGIGATGGNLKGIEQSDSKRRGETISTNASTASAFEDRSVCAEDVESDDGENVIGKSSQIKVSNVITVDISDDFDVHAIEPVEILSLSPVIEPVPTSKTIESEPEAFSSTQQNESFRPNEDETVIIYKALYDYLPRNGHSDELTLKQDDFLILQASNRNEIQWHFGRNLSTGLVGLFPCNYVAELVPMNYVAEFSYIAINPDELSLAAGEQILLLEIADDGWGTAMKFNAQEKQTKIGLVPLNYIKQQQTIYSKQ